MVLTDDVQIASSATFAESLWRAFTLYHPRPLFGWRPRKGTARKKPVAPVGECALTSGSAYEQYRWVSYGDVSVFVQVRSEHQFKLSTHM